MKADKRQIEQILRTGGKGLRAVLIYGPDEGLVRERAASLSRQFMGGLEDPFRFVEMSEEACLKDQALLGDEIRSIAMTGEQRLLRILASDSLTPILSQVLLESAKEGDGLLLMLSGDLGPRSPLRKLIEQSPDCMAIPCYKDSAADIAQIIKKQLEEAGLLIEPTALAYLTQNLGEDRGVTRAEIDKLILYMGTDKKKITFEDAVASTGDRAAFALDDLYYAITEGDHANAERYLTLNLIDFPPIVILRGLARHIAKLHFVAARMAKGEQMPTIINSLKPPLFWNVKAKFESQIRRLSPILLTELIDSVLGAEVDLLRQYRLSETLLRQLVFNVTEEIKGKAGKRA